MYNLQHKKPNFLVKIKYYLRIYFMRINSKILRIKSNMFNKYYPKVKMPKEIIEIQKQYATIVNENRYKNSMCLLINGVNIEKIWNDYIGELNDKISKMNFIIKFILKIKPKTSNFSLPNCPIIYNDKCFDYNGEFILFGNHMKWIEKKNNDEGFNELTLKVMDKRGEDKRYVFSLKDL